MSYNVNITLIIDSLSFPPYCLLSPLCGKDGEVVLDTNINCFLPGYHYKDQILPDTIATDDYRPPEIVVDADLTKRVAALETWAVNVDNRLKFFDQKLSKIDNLEAQIEQYSFKHLQQNLITILSKDDNSDAVAAKIKHHFDKNYVTKEEMQALSQQIHERLINSWKPEMNEDSIRHIVQEYLLSIERRQMEIIVEKVKEYVREIETRPVEVRSHVDLDEIKKMVAGMLDVYDADKTGLVDYALESAGIILLCLFCLLVFFLIINVLKLYFLYHYDYFALLLLLILKNS